MINPNRELTSVLAQAASSASESVRRAKCGCPFPRYLCVPVPILEGVVSLVYSHPPWAPHGLTWKPHVVQLHVTHLPLNDE